LTVCNKRQCLKTIYGTLISGRIFVSKDSTKLRETNVRDYLGFLNWLVLGRFFAKAADQAFDPKQENLFKPYQQLIQQNMISSYNLIK
jgi:hypothetical protein